MFLTESAAVCALSHSNLNSCDSAVSTAQSWIFSFTSLNSLSSGAWRSVGSLSEPKALFDMGVVRRADGRTVAIMAGGSQLGSPTLMRYKVYRL